MALLEKQLVVKKSNIPNAGKGLFTLKFIPKGTKVVEYKGKISSWKEADHQDGLNAYIYFINRNNVIDASKTKNALARYANDARGMGKLAGLKRPKHLLRKRVHKANIRARVGAPSLPYDSLDCLVYSIRRLSAVIYGKLDK